MFLMCKKVFLKNMDDFQKVNAVYAQAFGDHKPARSAVEVASEHGIYALFRIF